MRARAESLSIKQNSLSLRHCTRLSRHLRRIRRLSRAALATAPRLSQPVPQRPWAVRVHLPGGPIMPLEFALCCRLVSSRGFFVRRCVTCSQHGVGLSRHGRLIHITARMTSCQWRRLPLCVVDIGVHIGASVVSDRRAGLSTSTALAPTRRTKAVKVR